MYKIEKFLIDNGMRLKCKYPVGTLVYQDYYDDVEDAGFYGVDEVVLFPNHEPEPCWKILTGYPYLLWIPGYKDIGQDFIDRAKEKLEEHLKSQIEFNKRLQEIENPWEKVKFELDKVIYFNV